MHTFSRYRLLAVWLLWLGLWATLMPAQAQNRGELFLPAQEQPVAAQLPAGLKRTRTVQLNREVMKALEADGPHEVTLSLFADAVFTVNFERRESRSPIRYSWFGHIVGQAESLVVLVVEEQAISLNLRLPGKQNVTLRRLQDDLYLLLDWDDMKMPVCGVRPGQNLAEKPKPATNGNQIGVAAVSEIDVMIVYTPLARQTQGGTAAMRAECQLALDVANTAFNTSNTNTIYRLMFTQEISYTEGSNIDTILTHLEGTSDGQMDSVHATRNFWGADIVGIIVESGSSFAGVANLMFTLSTDFASEAFNVSQLSAAVSNLTFAHECAHNLGCGHDATVGGVGIYSYSKGWRFNGTNGVQYRTVMGYPPGTRIPRFSNPSIQYQGTATGTASADNARTLRETTSTAALWRPTAVARLWVDKAYAGASDGSFYYPYKTVTDALNAASPAHLTDIYVRANNYSGAYNVIKPVRVLNWDETGLVRIGAQ